MNSIFRVILIVFISIVFTGLLARQGLILLARVQYESGTAHYKTGAFDNALTCLQSASGLLENPILRSGNRRDLFRIKTEMGKTHYQLARTARVYDLFYSHLQEAAGEFVEAMALDSSSYRTTAWAARIFAATERYGVTETVIQKGIKLDATGLYQRAIALRPTGSSIYLEMIRHLYHKGDTQKIPELVEIMARMSPLLGAELKKEPFYTETLRKNVISGLLAAVQAGTNPRLALTLLSRIAQEDGEIKAAASYLRQALTMTPGRNTVEKLIRMGSLLLMSNETMEAELFFTQALSTGDGFEKTLSLIYKVYRSEQKSASFTAYLGRLKSRVYDTREIDLAIAEAHIDGGRLESAAELLGRLVENGDGARAHDLMARVHHLNQDWHLMEMAAQRATHLEPNGAVYWARLAKALFEQKDYVRAEAVATKAITKSTPPVYWYYGVRADIRKARKHYKAAAADWEKALEINPDFPYYYVPLARVYQAMGEASQAVSTVRRGLTHCRNNELLLNLEKEILP